MALSSAVAGFQSIANTTPETIQFQQKAAINLT